MKKISHTFSKKVSNRAGFTIIELMIAILVFTFGMLSAYMLVDSAMGAAINGRNEIIAANLAREQIELVKNLRDTNWLQNLNFMSTGAMNATAVNPNQKNIDINPIANFSEFGSGFYLIESRNGGDSEPTIYLKKLGSFSWTQGTKPSLDDIQLYQATNDSRFTHTSSNNTKTQFYSFIQLEPLKLSNGAQVSNAFRLTSVVATTQRGYREYVVRTIITDWKR